MKGYDIHQSVILERKLHLDRLYPGGIHIEEHSLIASGVTILSHDHCKRVDGQPLLSDTYIGKRCFIAVNATILPGVQIGDEVIVGAGSVVSRNVPSNVIVAGNPARIIRENISMNERAELVNWQNGQWKE
ncbi:acyltransferase [bacterium]|nr:acyltransferase [bacterium]